MEELSEREREALRLVSIGAMRIRSICRALPPSAVRDKVLDIADGMHNIPMVLAGGTAERFRETDLVDRDVVELKAAIDRANSTPQAWPKESSDTLLRRYSGSAPAVDATRELAIWFENTKARPDRKWGNGVLVAGMPEGAFRSLLGTAEVVQLRYAEPGVLEAAVVVLTRDDEDRFRDALHTEAHRHGTNPWIRNFGESAYRKAWDSGLPLFGG